MHGTLSKLYIFSTVLTTPPLAHHTSSSTCTAKCVGAVCNGRLIANTHDIAIHCRTCSWTKPCLSHGNSICNDKLRFGGKINTGKH